MRFSVLSLVLFALFVFVSQGVYGESSRVKLETIQNGLVRRQAARGNSGGDQSAEATPVKKAKASSIWASPAILQDGTLFYIAISISTLLWCTGKGVNMSLDQQERQAEYQARR